MAGTLVDISARLDLRTRLDERARSGHKVHMRLEPALVARLDARTPANDVALRSRDARIERALAAFANAPAERWTVAKLAKIAALSRAAFARRFTAEVGSPPLHYLASIRAKRAALLLETTDETLAEIAAKVGYANEFALSRAFRRELGKPPSVYRREIRSTTRSVELCLAA